MGGNEIRNSSPERGGGPFAKRMVEGAPLSSNNIAGGGRDPSTTTLARRGPPPRSGEELETLSYTSMFL